MAACLMIEYIICGHQIYKYGVLASPVLSIVCIGVVAWCFGFHCGSYHEYKRMTKIVEGKDGKEG